MPTFPAILAPPIERVPSIPGWVPGLLRRTSPLTESGELDLSDATGRIHAIWWVAERLPKDHSARPRLLAMGARVHRQRRAGYPEGIGFAGWCCGRFPSWGSGYSEDRVVPELATLDPYDPRRFPDGTRWVDAEAIRMIVLAVATAESKTLAVQEGAVGQFVRNTPKAPELSLHPALPVYVWEVTTQGRTLWREGSGEPVLTVSVQEKDGCTFYNDGKVSTFAHQPEPQVWKAGGQSSQPYVAFCTSGFREPFFIGESTTREGAEHYALEELISRIKD